MRHALALASNALLPGLLLVTARDQVPAGAVRAPHLVSAFATLAIDARTVRAGSHRSEADPSENEAGSRRSLTI